MCNYKRIIILYALAALMCQGYLTINVCNLAWGMHTDRPMRCFCGMCTSPNRNSAMVEAPPRSRIWCFVYFCPPFSFAMFCPRNGFIPVTCSDVVFLFSRKLVFLGVISVMTEQSAIYLLFSCGHSVQSGHKQSTRLCNTGPVTVIAVQFYCTKAHCY